jgi:hypothetical protein
MSGSPEISARCHRYARAMDRSPELFGVPFSELSIAHLEAALPAGEYEPLTWEAKGKRADRDEVRRQFSAFANASGGILFLGGEQEKRGGAWSWPGVPMSEEPIAWVDQVVRSGLDPVPAFVPRVVGHGPRGPVVAIAIEPVAEPPCITANGEVYERVSGRSIPVATSDALARLSARGDAARKRAVDASSEILDDLVIGGYVPEQVGDVLWAVGVGATSTEPDVGARIYRESYGRLMQAELGRYAQNGHFAKVQARHTSFGLMAWIYEFNQVEGAFLLVAEAGSVAYGWTDPDRTRGGGVSLATKDNVETVLGTLDRLLSAAGAAGRAHVRLVARFAEDRGPLEIGAIVVPAYQRSDERDATAWITLGEEPAQPMIERLLRDLRRRHGQAAIEPEA